MSESESNVRALVNPRECIACGECIAICPEKAISTDENGKAKVNPAICVGCGKCLSVCASEAISQVPVTES